MDLFPRVKVMKDEGDQVYVCCLTAIKAKPVLRFDFAYSHNISTELRGLRACEKITRQAIVNMRLLRYEPTIFSSPIAV